MDIFHSSSVFQKSINQTREKSQLNNSRHLQTWTRAPQLSKRLRDGEKYFFASKNLPE